MWVVFFVNENGSEGPFRVCGLVAEHFFDFLFVVLYFVQPTRWMISALRLLILLLRAFDVGRG